MPASAYPGSFGPRVPDAGMPGLSVARPRRPDNRLLADGTETGNPIMRETSLIPRGIDGITAQGGPGAGCEERSASTGA